MEGQQGKRQLSRRQLKEHIIDTAQALFTANGIKGITMDEIAAALGISKRTLYEVFRDKGELLEACIRRSQRELDDFLATLLATSGNVLEVLLKLFQYSIEKYHSTNKKFFEDLKKYPKACELMRSGHNRDTDDAVRFFREGVRQGIFRDDVNFAVVNLLVRQQFELLMDTDICQRFSFREVYESIMFTCLRGISTERGARELDEFLRHYRHGR